MDHTILTSTILFPEGSRYIQYYRFQIIDMSSFGIIEHRVVKEDGMETWSSIVNFSGYDVLAGNIRYVANILQPEKLISDLTDVITFQAEHLTNDLDRVTLRLPVRFNRIDLKLTRNSPYTVLQVHRQSGITLANENCITRWNLAGHSTPKLTIYFNVTQMPKHGHIYIHKGAAEKVYLGVGSVFQQSDIDSGHLFYKFRRVVDDWSGAVMHIGKGLIHVRDEFHFRLYVHSYRPSKEFAFNVDIIETTTESAIQLPAIKFSLSLSQQQHVDGRRVPLELHPLLATFKDTQCLKLPSFNFKATPRFEYILEILTQPRHGHVRIVRPDGSCWIKTNFLPIRLLPRGMLVYTPVDTSVSSPEEFQYRIICQDTRRILEDIRDNQMEDRLLILQQMLEGQPPVGSYQIQTLKLPPQMEKYSRPEIKLEVYEGQLLVKFPPKPSLSTEYLYLSCPHLDGFSECSGGYFLENSRSSIANTIVLSSMESREGVHVIPYTSVTFCLNCHLSDGVFSYYYKVPIKYAKVVVNFPEYVSLTVGINSTSAIFFPVS